MSDGLKVWPCPNDRALAPLVGQFRRRPGPAVRFYWCRWCEELFAFVGEGDSGGRLAASFAYDRARGAFVMWKTRGRTGDADLAQEAVASLGFVPGSGGG